jgi:predicted Zn-dependent protease
MNQKQAAKTQKKSKSRKTTPSKQIVKTQPLKEFSEIKPEPLPLSESPTSEPITLESQQSALPTPPAAQEQQEPSLTTSPVVSEAPKSSPPPPPAELTPFEPIEATVPLSPAVGALVSAANQNTKSGDLDSAAVSIERAIRIEPRNATLFYKLALLRLKQSKPRLAEDLAKKSALLASTDNALKKHCWLLIAHARELQQDFAGAKEARAKADNF